MNGPADESPRKLEPRISAKGRLTHWGCSVCNLTLPVAEDSTGMTPAFDNQAPLISACEIQPYDFMRKNGCGIVGS